MENFYTLLSNTGINAIIAARASNSEVKLTKIAVGDGDIIPSQDMTALKSEKHRFNINSIIQDIDNPNYLIVEGVIPSNVGGFYVSEVAIYTEQNTLFAIGSLPKTYKPLLEEGSAKDLTIKIFLEVTNADSVTLKVDDTVVLATRKFVLSELKKYALINGDETKKFKVADAVEPKDAINKKQFDDNAVKLTGKQTITGAKTFSGLSKTSIGDNALEVITSSSNNAAGSFMVSQGVKYGLALNGSGTGLETGSFNFQVIDRDLKTVQSMPFSIGINGVVSYDSFPVTPSSAPTTNYQVVNKKYVDNIENISSLSTKTTPVDTDNLKIQESGGLFKKLSWANLKANLFDGAMSLTKNGYIKLPSIMGGIIFQWGIANFVFATGAGTLSKTVTFPIAFTAEVYTLLPSLITNTPNSFNSSYGSLSLSSFVFYCSSNGATGTLDNTWFAVGR